MTDQRRAKAAEIDSIERCQVFNASILVAQLVQQMALVGHDRLLAGAVFGDLKWVPPLAPLALAPPNVEHPIRLVGRFQINDLTF